MLVKISDNFFGNFGALDPETGIVQLKRQGDPPFDMDDKAAQAHIKSGVLVPADAEPVTVTEPEPVPVQEPADSAEIDIAGLPMKTLKAMAKERKINSFGKSREELADLIRQADAEPAEIDASESAYNEGDCEDAGVDEDESFEAEDPVV